MRFITISRLGELPGCQVDLRVEDAIYSGENKELVQHVDHSLGYSVIQRKKEKDKETKENEQEQVGTATSPL